MHDVTITFGKVVATPTAGAWSQAYNAGSLFAVLSLKTESETLLNVLGKDIIKSLEEEYFTLEEKNLESIKHAVTESVKKIPEGIEVSFIAATLVRNILYLYLYGGGEVVVRRNNAMGKILSSDHSEEDKVISASGEVENNDAIVLQTEAFTNIIDKQMLKDALSSILPSDATESLAPKIHEKEAGDASAIILYFKTLSPHPNDEEITEPKIEEPVQYEEQKELNQPQPEVLKNSDMNQDLPHQPEIHSRHIITDEEPNLEEKHSLPNKRKIPNFFSFFKKWSGVSHSRKLILSIVIIVIAVFALSIYFAGKHSESSKLNTEFQAVYPQANDKVKQAQVLEQLNPTLSHDEYVQAKQYLVQNQDKFPEGSAQRQQIDSLISKIDNSLASSQKASQSGTNRSALNVLVLNGSGVEGAAGKMSNVLTPLGYNVSGTKNADNYNYTGVTIRVKPDKKAYLDTLKKDLSSKFTITSATADLPSSSSEDVDVIVGK